MNKANKNSGLGLVEIVVVIALILTAFVGLLQLVVFERQVQRSARDEAAAYAVARQDLEAVRSIRDVDFESISSLATDTPYYPEVSGNEWTLTLTDPGPIDIYTTWVEKNNVRRDANDDIADTGNIDPDTYKIIAFVQWEERGEIKTISVETYLTNWQAYK